jgi:hypothetical protein
MSSYLFYKINVCVTLEAIGNKEKCPCQYVTFKFERLDIIIFDRDKIAV